MALEFKRALPGTEFELARLFKCLTVDSWFHPFPLTLDEARKLCWNPSMDLFYVATDGERVLAFGMLRGWDEGYEIPSLGVAVHPGFRGTGLGRALMGFLHAAARAKGAEKVRLKVFPENTPAVGLYRNLGYKFREEKEAGQLVGFFDLGTKKSRDP